MQSVLDRLMDVIRECQCLESLSPEDSFNSLGIDDTIDLLWCIEKEFDVREISLRQLAALIEQLCQAA